MKRLFIAMAALSLLCAPAHAQSFLNRLKEKAEQAVSGAMGETPQPRIQTSVEAGIPQAVSGEQALPPRRASSFGWDGPVFKWSVIFPLVICVCNFLAARSCFQDQLMVESAYRVRERRRRNSKSQK